MERVAFCIDLDSSRPEVLEFSGKELEQDLKFFGVKNPEDLTDPDRRVFNSEDEAESFLERYHKVYRSLKTRCKRQSDLPCMLYRRRYIILALMGLKTYTERGYDKGWKPGQLFQFHDQVHFLTVRLTKITAMADSQGPYWKYEYELV